jgi:phosphatidylserine synthase
MLTKKSLPNLVTLTMGFVASIAILLIGLGQDLLAIRLVFLALSLDVLDGYLARKLNATSDKGALLDRLFDRLYQVIVPVTIYLKLTSGSILSIIYGAVLITVSYWRIAEVKPSSAWFTGLPLNIHTLVIISSYLSKLVIPPAVMLLLLVPTLLPINYAKRLGEPGQSTNKGTFWQIRLVVPLILVFMPYDEITWFFYLLLSLAFAYVLVGWIPPWMWVRRKGTNQY